MPIAQVSHKDIFMSIERNLVTAPVPFAEALGALRAAAEETRLRILALLAEGELSVSDLTDILGQSQPRISRHLKLLVEAGLVERHRGGSLGLLPPDRRAGAGASICADLRASTGRRPPLSEDRPGSPRCGRSAPRQRRAILRACAGMGPHALAPRRRDGGRGGGARRARASGRSGSLLDLGTGTGPHARAAGAARAGAPSGSTPPRHAGGRPRQSRDGRACRESSCARATSTRRRSAAAAFDLVIIHQVLHYLDDPARALREAARVSSRRAGACSWSISRRTSSNSCASATRIVASASRREQIAGWLADAGLDCTSRPRPRAAGAGRATSSPSRSGSASDRARRRRSAAALRDARRSPDDRHASSARSRATAARPIRVSFEFFPPKTDGDGGDALGARSSASRRSTRTSSR